MMERDYIGEIDKLKDELNNCRQGVIKVLDPDHVWVVFLHDMILDVCKTEASAMAIQKDYVQRNPGNWRSVGTRWTCDSTGTGWIVSRLERVKHRVTP